MLWTETKILAHQLPAAMDDSTDGHNLCTILIAKNRLSVRYKNISPAKKCRPVDTQRDSYRGSSPMMLAAWPGSAHKKRCPRAFSRASNGFTLLVIRVFKKNTPWNETIDLSLVFPAPSLLLPSKQTRHKTAAYSCGHETTSSVPRMTSFASIDTYKSQYAYATKTKTKRGRLVDYE